MTSNQRHRFTPLAIGALLLALPMTASAVVPDWTNTNSEILALLAGGGDYTKSSLLALDNGQDLFRYTGKSCAGAVEVRWTDGAEQGVSVPAAKILASELQADGRYLPQAISTTNGETERELLAVNGGSSFRFEIAFVYGSDEAGHPATFSRSFQADVACDEIVSFDIEIPSGFTSLRGDTQGDVGDLPDWDKMAEMGRSSSGGAVKSLRLNSTNKMLTGPGATFLCQPDDFGDDLLHPQWNEAFIGDADQGGAVESGGAIQISGDGTSLYHGTDNAFFLYQEVNGDFRAEVQLTGFPGSTGAGANFRKAGLHVSSSLDDSAERVMIQLVEQHPTFGTTALQFDYRDEFGNTLELGSTPVDVPLPLKMAIVRRGDEFTVYFSEDGGFSWLVPAGGANSVGGTIEIPMPSQTLVGMTVASYDANNTFTAEFDNFDLCHPNPDPAPEPPPELACQPLRTADILYVLDSSGSMTLEYPGSTTKLDAARDAMAAMNDLLEQELPGSRAALITYSGSFDPTFNLTQGVEVLSGYTTDFDFVDAAAANIDVSMIDPDGATTPFPLALEAVVDLLTQQHDPARIPVVVNLTDTVPNIDLQGEGPSEYAFDDIQAISLKDSMDEFLPWGQVAWMGNYNSSLSNFTGQVLAESMYQILQIKDNFLDTLMYGVAIQGDGVASSVFREDLLEFAAYYSGGAVFSAESATDILDALEAVVSAIDCGSSIGDRVWLDANGDGIQDAGEAGIPGVTVRLFDDNGVQIGEVITGPDGEYVFDGLLGGTYTVRVVVSTLPAGSDVPTFDLDGLGTAHTTEVVLALDEDRTDIDFGYTNQPPDGGCETDDFEDASLGPAWSQTSLGDDTLGAADESGGTLNVTSDGSELYHGVDNAYFVYQAINGDFRAEVDITDVPLDEGGDRRKGGLKVRSGTGGTDERVMAMLVPEFSTGNMALLFDARSVAGQPATELSSTVQNISLPVRVAIQRVGDTFTVYYSTDGGTNWIQPLGGLGGQVDIPTFGATALAGVAAASDEAGTAFTASFDDFRLCEPDISGPPDVPPPVCDPALGTDIIYLLDRSGSMTHQLASGQTKFDTAKQALLSMNTTVQLLGGDERSALITFRGNDDPAFNLASGAQVISGVTDDLSAIGSLVGSLDLDGVLPSDTTPATQALQKTLQVLLSQNDPSTHNPVVLWITDAVPNIDGEGNGPREYNLDDVAALSIRDGAGDFLTQGQVAWLGDYHGTTDTYTGEVLASAMDAIEDFAVDVPEARIFGVVLTGDGRDLGSYSTELQDYSTYYTNGNNVMVDNLADLEIALQQFMSQIFCGDEGTGNIGDFVWFDTSGDGVQDALEPGIEGVSVDLVNSGGTVVASATTDDAGLYLFTGVPAGTYTVVVDAGSLPAGRDIATYDYDGTATPHEANVTIGAFESNLDLDFGYMDSPDSPPLDGCFEDDFDDAVLESGWQSHFLGNADQGGAVESDGTLKVSGDGTGMFSSDHGFFVYRDVSTSAFRAEVDILGTPVPDGSTIYRKTGLQVRNGLDSLSPRLFVLYQPLWPDSRGSLQFRFRSGQGGNGGDAWATSYIGVSLPVRVAIEKQGDLYTVQFSEDGGNTWVKPAGGIGKGDITIDMGDDLLVGMTATAYDSNKVLTGEFDNFSLCDLSVPVPNNSECVAPAVGGPYNGSGGHAVWMPGISKKMIFDGANGSFLEYPDGTATLTGSVYPQGNPSKVFDIDVQLSGFTTVAPPGSPKKEMHNSAYAPVGPVDPSTWHYYPSWTGTLTGQGDWAGAVVELTPRGPVWQVGDGANNKNIGPGASSWFSWVVTTQPSTGQTLQTTGNGDFNVSFACP